MSTVDRPLQPAWWQPTPLHREMAYVGGALYASGGLLLALTLLVPAWEERAVGWIGAVAMTACLVGVFFLWAAERLPLPRWLYVTATGFGAVLVTIVVVAGGPHATAAYGVLYVFVAAYAFYYYPVAIAAGEVVLVGVGYAIGLAGHHNPAAGAEWLMVVGAAVIVGGLIGSLGQRVRGLLAIEQATVSSLSELDRWKTTFLRAVAHDLRSPLMGLVGLVTTVHRHGDRLDEQQREELLTRAVASGGRLQVIIEDLLDLERIEAGHIRPRLQPMALDLLVRECVERLELAIETMEIVAEPVTALVEPSKIERIVANLVSNAVRHTPDGTRIWVRVGGDSDRALLVVEDDGPGIPIEARDRLFDAFHGDHGLVAPDSVGLGLHLVRRFTELHGGEVLLTDRSGGGTRFEVRLPLLPPF